MKRVEPIISMDEYIKRAYGPIEAEVRQSFEKQRFKIPQRIKRNASIWYLLLAILIIVVDFLVIPLLFSKNFREDQHSVEWPQICWSILFFVLLITGIVMYFKRKIAIKRINNIFTSGMNIDKIHKIAIESFPYFKLLSTEKKYTKELNKYTYNIPSDADAVDWSPVFKIMFKEKHEIIFQASKYRWVTETDDDNSVDRIHHANSGYMYWWNLIIEMWISIFQCITII